MALQKNSQSKLIFFKLNLIIKSFDDDDEFFSRFMGMRAALFTGGSSVGSFARKLGFRLLEIDELVKKEALPAESSIASELLSLLGLSGGKVSEQSDVDLVVLHIRAGQKLRALKDKAAIDAGVDWLDGLVSTLLTAAQPGSEVASRLHFSVVLTFGEVTEDEAKNPSALISPTRNDSDLSLLRPCQSYCMKGGARLDNVRYGDGHGDHSCSVICRCRTSWTLQSESPACLLFFRHHHPMLVAQWQEGVTRRDLAEQFSLAEFQEASPIYSLSFHALMKFL